MSDDSINSGNALVGTGRMGKASSLSFAFSGFSE